MLTCAACGGLTPPEASSSCLHCEAPLPRPPSWLWRLPVLLGPVGAVLLAACYGAPGRYAMEPRQPDEPMRLDRDGDGARGAWECPPNPSQVCLGKLSSMPAPTDVDCADDDPARYPGAADPDGDGIDQNCDGADGWAQPNVRATP